MRLANRHLNKQTGNFQRGVCMPVCLPVCLYDTSILKLYGCPAGHADMQKQSYDQDANVVESEQAILALLPTSGDQQGH